MQSQKYCTPKNVSKFPKVFLLEKFSDGVIVYFIYHEYVQCVPQSVHVETMNSAFIANKNM